MNRILPDLGDAFEQHILIVQHLSADSDSFLAAHFSKLCRGKVLEAEDKLTPEPGTIYFAPANYHMMVEVNGTIALSVQERVNFSRPSIDVLFETAAEAYFDKLIGVILTGANNDGTAGLKRIKELGGLAVVQSPESAEAYAMPESAMENVEVDHVVPLEEMGHFLKSLLLDNHEES